MDVGNGVAVGNGVSVGGAGVLVGAGVFDGRGVAGGGTVSSSRDSEHASIVISRNAGISAIFHKIDFRPGM